MDQQLDISEYIKRWGSSASIALQDPRCKIFKHPSIDGIIGYQIHKNYNVIFGDPVCSQKNVQELATAFYNFSKDQSKELIYLSASKTFADWANKNGFPGLLEAEEELIMDPAAYPKKGSNGQLLRKKLNHALRLDVTLKEYDFQDEKIKKDIQALESQWIKGRKGPQIFLSKIDFFEDLNGKRCFYAMQNDRMVGALLLTQVGAHQGWLLYLLMTTPDAPGGTSESLILAALDKLTEEKCSFFSFGNSAAEQLGEITGLNNLSAWIARLTFKLTKKIFQLDKRRLFWKKFQPQNSRSFILFSKPRIGISEILAVMKTLNASL